MKQHTAILLLLSSIDSVDAFLSLRQSLVCLGSSRPSLSATSKTCLNVGNLGWDNENFLESLNKGPDAIENANREYDRLKRFGKRTEGEEDTLPTDNNEVPTGSAGLGEGAELTAEQIEKVKQRNKEEIGEGGEMFKNLLERAKKGESRTPPSYIANPQPAATPPASSATPAASSPTADLPPGFEQLSPEAQAKVFLELMKNKNEPSAQKQPEETPPSASPKKMRGGVGPDGRRIGRNRDADAIVNSSDVYFAQLKLDSSVRNQARYNGQEEVADEVFADPRLQDIQLHVNPYLEDQRKKEQMMLETAQDEMITSEMYAPSKPLNKRDKGISYKEKLQQKRKTASSPQAAVQPSPTRTTTPPSPPETSPPSVETPPVQQVSEIKQTVQPPSPPTEASEVTQEEPLVEPSVSMREIPVAPAPVPPVSESKSPEATRSDIRTLMGLLLKHRGGPGFGSGRLQGAEMEKFEKLSDDVLSALRAEAVEAPTQQPVVRSDDQSPGGAISPQPRIPTGERVNSAIACVEGAVQMFKSSPPELQGGMMVALHAALSSAAKTFGELVDEKQSERNDEFRTITSDVRTRTAAKPVPMEQELPTTIDVPVASPSPDVPVEASAQDPSYSGNDENSQFLEGVYEKLQRASGQGKLGLSDDFQDAEGLLDDLAKMRMLLVEELESGIPEEQSPTSSPSKYQEMLAKVKAERKEE